MSKKKEKTFAVVTNGEPDLGVIPTEIFEALCESLFEEIIAMAKEKES